MHEVTRHRKTEAIDYVVQAALQLLQKQLASDALGALCTLKVVAELGFLGEVHALRLLLLAKLKPIAHDFGLAVLAVLPRCEIALFDRTLVCKAL